MTSRNNPNGVQRIGLCVDCNYPLQGLTADRCPECGRAFNCNQPTTMNMGRPVGPVGRRLLRPIGWFTIIAALLSTAAMVSVTRFPLGRPTNEARFYLRLTYWKTPDPARDWHEWVYLIAMLTTAWVAAIFVCRLLARAVLPWIYRRPRPGRRLARHLMVLALLAINGIAIFMGWPYRAGRMWVAHEIVADNMAHNSAAGLSVYFQPIACPFPLSDADGFEALVAAATTMPEPRARLTAVQLLAFHHPSNTAAALIRLAEHERDGEVCAAEIHLYAVLARRDAMPLLDRFLGDPRPQVRAAAADGIGVVCSSEAFQSSLEGGWRYPPSGVELDARTPALFVDLSSGRVEPATPPSPQQRVALEKMMRSGAESVEREAAARALQPWPPQGYSLRVAEWGVWVSDGGELKLVQSVIDEIPPFVHRTGNAVGEFRERINGIMFVSKPIIHLTSNVLMSVDLSVLIRAGRPWYAYPLPDDFAISVAMFDNRSNNAWTVPLTALDKPALGRLTDVREGYPWLLPHHRSFGSFGAGGGSWRPHNEAVSLGLRWQSLIVSPEKLPWMQAPVVGNDPQFAWWEKLRHVPSCWVSSRGEADRFLYYDGPTLARTPVVATLNGTVLYLAPYRLESQELTEAHPGQQPRQDSPAEWAFDAGGTFAALAQSTPHPRRRRGVFIEVTGGHVRAREFAIPDGPAGIPIAERPADLQGPAVEAHFLSMLLERGLTAEEAGGLIASWEAQFFHKDGRRFLLLMSPHDYDMYCPIQVRPAPSALARVGVVLTEF